MSDALPAEPVFSVLKKADERERKAHLKLCHRCKDVATLHVLHITYNKLSAAKQNRIKVVHKKNSYSKGRGTILYNL